MQSQGWNLYSPCHGSMEVLTTGPSKVPVTLMCCLCWSPGVTDCQKNEMGLQCDQDGQYRASQRDRTSGKAFLWDMRVRAALDGTEAPLVDAQCLSVQATPGDRVRSHQA